MPRLLTILFTLFLAAVSHGVEVSLSSRNLVVGESTYLTITVPDEPLKGRPPVITQPGLSIGFTQNRGLVVNGKRTYSYSYQVTAAHAGLHTIPAITLSTDSKTYTTQTKNIRVHPRSVLTKSILNFEDQIQIPCYSVTFTGKDSLFPNEATHAELKIYYPSDLRIADFGLPSPEKNNCSAWRFNPNTAKKYDRVVTLDGSRHSSLSLQTTLRGHAPGRASFGPTTTSLTGAFSTNSGGFIQRIVNLRATLVTPAKQLSIKPLPTGAPAGYRGAVGQFSLTSPPLKQTTIRNNGSINIVAQVVGHGWIDNNLSPTLEQSDEWKLLDMSRNDRGAERSALHGTHTYQFLIRPEKQTEKTPDIHFVYLDPNTEKYVALKALGQAVTLEKSTTASTTTSPSPSQPKEEQQDILGLIPNALPNYPKSSTPLWIWLSLPALPFLWVLIGAFRRRHALSIERNPVSKAKKEALQQLAAQDDDFLKHASHYIAQWLPNQQDEEIQAIIKERDASYYQPATQRQPVTAERKKQVLQLLKKASFLIATLLVFLPSDLQAGDFDMVTKDAESAWDAGDFQSAAAHYTELLERAPNSPDYLYNLGNCHYRLGEPGKAALFYQRALEQAPKHPEARKNLTFVQKSLGSLAPDPLNGTKRYIAYFNQRSWLLITAYAAWAVAIFIIASACRTRRSPWRFLGMIISILIVGAGLYGYFAHPDKATEGSEKKAIVLTETKVLTEPNKSSSSKQTLLTAPPASECLILAERGNWHYVLFPNKTRGWVSADCVAGVSSQ